MYLHVIALDTSRLATPPSLILVEHLFPTCAWVPFFVLNFMPTRPHISTVCALHPTQRYTLDPFEETEQVGTSGCTKLHLVAAVLDPKTKLLKGVPRAIQDKAFDWLEALGAQIIDEKLAAEFGEQGDGPLLPQSSPDHTSTGPDPEDGQQEDEGTTAEAKKRNSKSILSDVANLSDDEEVSTRYTLLFVGSLCM